MIEFGTIGNPSGMERGHTTGRITTDEHGIAVYFVGIVGGGIFGKVADGRFYVGHGFEHSVELNGSIGQE